MVDTLCLSWFVYIKLKHAFLCLSFISLFFGNTTQKVTIHLLTSFVLEFFTFTIPFWKLGSKNYFLLEMFPDFSLQGWLFALLPLLSFSSCDCQYIFLLFTPHVSQSSLSHMTLSFNWTVSFTLVLKSQCLASQCTGEVK